MRRLLLAATMCLSPAIACAQGFTITNGHINGPSGAPFVARGTSMWTFSSAASVLATFPGVNVIRLAACSGFGVSTPCYGNNNSPDTATSLAPFVNAITSKGVLVIIEDHAYWSSAVPTGSVLTSQATWYASLATAFKNNPLVAWGTPNEPNGPATDITTQQQATYNAIRGTGSNQLIELEMNGGANNNFAAQSPAVFAAMHNVVWDQHFYAGSTNHSLTQSQMTAQLVTAISAAQQVRSGDGVVPVIIGEYGISASSGTDPQSALATHAVQVDEAAYGSIAWVYWDGGLNKQVASNGGALNTWGQQVAAFVATAAPPTSPVCMTVTVTAPNGTSTPVKVCQ